MAERPDLASVHVPQDARGQRELLRALINVRPPEPVTDEFLAVQDAYLAERLSERGVMRLEELVPVGEARAPQIEPDVAERLYLWRGDITTLATDAIVNAANARMLGCFVPGHHCIDNAIHTFAGVQLRRSCAKLMWDQGHEEPTGSVKVTPGFNLPARYVLHTVGPIVYGKEPTARDQWGLRSAYRSCLEAATQTGCSSVAFCCVSTGVFHYPNDAAARVAIEEVTNHLRTVDASLRVVFNVFLEKDERIYHDLLFA